jgi:hypothetical protein
MPVTCFPPRNKRGKEKKSLFISKIPADDVIFFVFFFFLINFRGKEIRKAMQKMRIDVNINGGTFREIVH